MNPVDVTDLSLRILLAGCVGLLLFVLVGVVINSLFIHFGARLVGHPSGWRPALQATLLTWLFGALAALFTGAVLARSSLHLAITVNLLTSAAAGAAAVLIAYRMRFLQALGVYAVASLLMLAVAGAMVGGGMMLWRPTGGWPAAWERVQDAAEQAGVPISADTARNEHVASPVPLSDAPRHLGKQVEVDLRNGETAIGTLLATDDDVLVVRERLPSGGGTIELRLRRERVVEFRVRE